MGLELGLGLGGFAMRLGSEARFPTFMGLTCADPASDWPGNEAKLGIRSKSSFLGLPSSAIRQPYISPISLGGRYLLI